MRRFSLVLAAAALAGAAAAAPGASAQAVPLVSDNVTPLTTVPVGKPIGARFRDDHMFVTGVDGLTVYDVSEPASPRLVGALPLPHFENEDVDLAGDVLLISNDPSEGVGLLYVIDISDPALPTLKSVLPTGVVDVAQQELLGFFGVDDQTTPAAAAIGHTASCVDRSCSYVYLAGTNRGIDIVDLRDPANPVKVKRFVPEITGLATHDVQVDDTGLAWIVGYEGSAAYDVTDPLNPRMVARTDIANSGGLGVPVGNDGKGPLDFIHHNSLRLGSVDEAGDTVPFAQQAGKTYPAGGNAALIGIVEEDYTRPTCEGAGSFQTWSIGEDGVVSLLDTYETELDNLVTGRGVAPLAGLCSAHYFDHRDGIVAAGWYEEGTRILDVRDPANIRQVGYWVPPKGATWAAYFPPTDPTGEIVYALDVTRGIDVLRVDRTDLAPRKAPVRRSWLARTNAGKRLAANRSAAPGRFGWVCRLPL